MKSIKITCLLSFLAIQLAAQPDSATADSILRAIVADYDSSGLFIFQSNKVLKGDLFKLYQKYWVNDTFNTAVETQSWQDSKLNYNHYKYQQNYYNIPVEGAEFIEHESDGYIIAATGKLADLHNTPPSSAISYTEAVSIVLDSLDNTNLKYAWDDLDWETELQSELNDPSATYFPPGKVMWALDAGIEGVTPVFLNENFRLAWVITVSTIDPFSETDYYVDVSTKAIFKSTTSTCSNGPANVEYYGNQTIDTRPKNSKFILHTDDNGRNVHTKYASSIPWSMKSNVKDDDDNWGTNEQVATTAHHTVTAAWDFFDDYFDYQGCDNNGGKVRVLANWSTDNANYSHSSIAGWDRLRFGNLTENFATYDIASHEYGHGINKHTANLKGSMQAAGLNEGFSDIYGILGERYTLAPTSDCNGGGGDCDWMLGEDATVTYKYDAINPKADSFPNTFEGDYFYWGPHYTGAVLVHWFRLLSMGGAGVNDNGGSYFLTGIGIDDAAEIVFYTHTNLLVKKSDYNLVASSTEAAASLLFPNDPSISQAVACTWAAVGLGGTSVCSALNNEQPKASVEFSIFPNPTSGHLNLRMQEGGNKSIVIRDMQGRILKVAETIDQSTSIDLSAFDAGIYFVTLKLDIFENTQKIIIVR
ncbi:MAG: M4 family metallopeptidase [Cryomorphaceae bacterium]